jgi:hypothetical protein
VGCESHVTTREVHYLEAEPGRQHRVGKLG